MSMLPTSVTITDDTMREGLQIESADIPVSAKLRLLDALGETGAKVISIPVPGGLHHRYERMLIESWAEEGS